MDDKPSFYIHEKMVIFHGYVNVSQRLTARDFRIFKWYIIHFHNIPLNPLESHAATHSTSSKRVIPYVSLTGHSHLIDPSEALRCSPAVPTSAQDTTRAPRCPRRLFDGFLRDMMEGHL